VKSPDEPAARHALVSEIPILAATLQAAFEGYVWTDWAFSAEDRAERVRASFVLYLHASLDGLGQVWTTDDLSCVAIWVAPEPKRWADRESDRLRERAATLLGAHADRVAAADDLVAGHHPGQPYWFLAAVGTRPDRQGRGLATAVLAPMLRRCDRQRVAAVLDTSTRGNVRFYSRLGFEVTAEMRPVDGSPLVWVMTRAPRATNTSLAMRTGLPDSTRQEGPDVCGGDLSRR
jgi:GNAT superfamily N-acetyltransferase